MNLFEQISQTLKDYVKTLEPGLDDPSLANIVVEPPRDPSHGEMATNAAMVLAKKIGMRPKELAENIQTFLKADSRISDVSIAGPGFINLSLYPDVWWDATKNLLVQHDDWGLRTVEHPHHVNIEFVSANPTGPMHVGHCRGAVVGDCLANILLQAGYRVTREYYVNDAGAQVDVLARSTYLRYCEALGKDIGEIPQGLYPGSYLCEVGRQLASEYGSRFVDKPEDIWLETFRKFAIDKMMDSIKEDLSALRIVHDVFTSEKDLVSDGAVERALDKLSSLSLMYHGILEPPKGKPDDDWEPREQYLFKSTKFGDDVDRPVQKSDGTWTYFASDIAYHQQKAEGADILVNIWGADHGGYVKRMSAATKAITDNAVSLQVVLCQLVRLFQNGEPIKMSKRSGSFVTLREVVDEVGCDAVRFMMLMRKADAPLDFDFAKVIEKSKENPVFYVQYAHARIASVLRRAGDELQHAVDDKELLQMAKPLTDPMSLELMRKVAEYPRMIEQAAVAYEPHRVAYYAYDLASLFHAYWNRGKEEGARFIDPDHQQNSLNRLALARLVGLALRRTLCVMAVEPVSEM